MSIALSLNDLENSGLIQQAQAEPELEYMFRHALVQDASYESLLKADRRALHTTVAQTLEGLYPSRLDEFAATLADHYEHAEDYPKALEYYLRAGKAAAKVYANAEATLLFSRAVELLSLPESKSTTKIANDLFSEYGRVLELSGKFEAAIENYRQMQAEAIRRREKQMEMDSLIAQAIIQATPSPVHNIPQAQLLCEQALVVAHALQNREAESRIYWIMLLINYFGQDNAKSIEYGKKSLEIARAINHRERMAFTLNDIARSYFSLNDFDNAAAASQEARALWEELGNMPMLADNLTSYAEYQLLVGDFNQAFALTQRAYEIGKKINNAWGQSYALSLQTQIYWNQGEIARCLQSLEISEALKVELPFAKMMNASIRMELYTEFGQYEKALQAVEDVRFATERAMNSFDGYYELTLAYVASARGDMEVTEKYIEIAKAKRLEVNFNTFAPLYFGTVEYRRGMAAKRYAEVAQTLLDTIVELEKTRVNMLIPLLRYWRATALISDGHIDDTRAELLSALELSERNGTRIFSWKIHAALAKISTGEESARHLQSARKIIQYTTDHAPEDLRTSYLNLPEVQKIMAAV
jgi:tetratricopeptide (TPR) repeat protein